MTILIYFLTIVFGIVCFVIMKKKRYKVMPLICLIMFICFIGFGSNGVQGVQTRLKRKDRFESK